jgi:hypothetical protein
MKKDYVEFSIGKKHLQLTVESHWECRNEGLLKIMTRAFEYLQERGEITESYTVRINTADGPTKDPVQKKSNFIEFDTSSRSTEQEGLFPDYIFGNWWHIGLRDFDSFTKEITDNSSHDTIKDKRLFWIGNLMGIRQRVDYIELCKKHPEKFAGIEMTWTDAGRTPTFFVQTKDYCNYKYLLDLSGHGCSGRLKLLPFCGRPLFITDRHFWSWSDIAILGQKLHVPLKADLSDILEKLEYTEINYESALANASKLAEYCKREFTFEKICRYASDLLAKKIIKNKDATHIRAKSPMKFDVVVAHYKENLAWVDKLNHDWIGKIHVYTKGTENLVLNNPKTLVTRLPNIGRESHTYLYHCYSHYDEINEEKKTDFVFFVQGSPHGMEGERLYKAMQELSENREMKFTSNFRVSSAYSFLNKGRCDSWQGQTSRSKYDIKEWCDNFLRSDLQIEKIPVFWNACFGVSSDRILSNHKEKYKFLMEGELSELNPECGHYFERLWYYVFNMDAVKLPVVYENCWEFWGGEQNSQRFYGLMKFNDDGTIGLYDNFNEAFWEDRGEKRVILNRNKEPTCVMDKLNEDKYSGEFIPNRKVIHTAIKFQIPPQFNC